MRVIGIEMHMLAYLSFHPTPHPSLLLLLEMYYVLLIRVYLWGGKETEGRRTGEGRREGWREGWVDEIEGV